MISTVWHEKSLHIAVLIAGAAFLTLAGCSREQSTPPAAPPGQLHDSTSGPAGAPVPGVVEPGLRTELPARLRTPTQPDGWFLAGPPPQGADPAKPSARATNQLILSFPTPPDHKKIKGRVTFSADTDKAAVIVDMIWYRQKAEIARSVASTEAPKDQTTNLEFAADRPADADELVLIVRPWRDQDGLVTVMGGELEWTK